jgi:segregation and condensation protein A
MSYKVKLDIFEGPFDLLVYLIERSGLNIYDVNISEIISRYIEYVSAMHKYDPEGAAEFMVLAATLIRIKSRTLLPSDKKEDVPPEEDIRDELARRLEDYKKIRYLAQYLRQRESQTAHIYTKPREDISVYTDSPQENLEISINQFMSAFKAFLERKKNVEDVKKRYQRIDRERMTMEIKSEHIYAHVKRSQMINFTSLINDFNDTYDIVLTFAAVLEMLKSGMINASQDSIFGDIIITL